MNNIEHILQQILENQTKMQTDINSLNSDMGSMKSDMSSMKSDMNSMKSDMNSMKSDMNSMKSEMTSMKSDIKDLKTGQIRIEAKLDSVYDQTAKTCEDITAINLKLDELREDFEFLAHKENQTEKEVYSIKKKLQVIK